jgi:hypothetical protein
MPPGGTVCSGRPDGDVAVRGKPGGGVDAGLALGDEWGVPGDAAADVGADGVADVPAEAAVAKRERVLAAVRGTARCVCKASTAATAPTIATARPPASSRACTAPLSFRRACREVGPFISATE